MNFINDRELARRFKNNAVPSKERLYYFLIFMMLMALMTTSYGMNLFHAPINHWDIAADMLELLVTLFGTIFLYRTNAKGDNKEFIERYICIGFPIIIQSILLGIVFVIIVFGIMGIGSGNETSSSDIYSFLLISLMMGYYYFRLNQSLKIASN